MKQLIYILLIIALASCAKNETCRNQTFGDATWMQDSGVFMFGINVRFDDDDTLRVDQPMFGQYNIPIGRYEFDEWCGGFVISSVHYEITRNDHGIIWLQRQDGGVGYFHQL